MTQPPTSTRVVGNVTPSERDVIRRLFERRNGLLELFKVLPELEGERGAELYEKVVSDLGEVTTRQQDWWADVSRRYGWQDTAGMRWELDFETCRVTLIGPATRPKPAPKPAARRAASRKAERAR
jgi:CXXX repeat modification system protein